MVKSTMFTVYPDAEPVNRIVSSASTVVSTTGVIVKLADKPSVVPILIVTDAVDALRV